MTSPGPAVPPDLLERLFARAQPEGAAEGASEAGRLQGLLRESLAGSMGAPARAAAWSEVSPALRLGAARLLRDLSAPGEAWRVICAAPPPAYPDVEALAFVAALLLELPASQADVDRAWLSRLVEVWSTGEAAAAVAPFLRKLGRHGALELVDALRESEAGRLLSAADLALMDATLLLWSAKYVEVDARLSEVSLEGEDRVEADLLITLARAAEHPTADDVARLDGLLHGPLRGQGRLREVAERWRVELLLRLGRREEAETASDHPVQRLLQRMIQMHTDLEAKRTVDAGLHHQVIERLGAFRPDLGVDDGQPEEARLWKLVEAFGGNRTDTVTLLDGATPRVVSLPTARQEAVLVQAEVPARGLAWAHAELGRLALQHPTAGVYETYRAEVLLWEGRYEEALAIFEAAWRASKNRWSYIGRGAALAALGRDEEASAVWDEGTRYHRRALPGEATFTYRAEVALRRGEIDAAHRLLRAALEGNPSRLRAWVLEAEVLFQRGDRAPARAALEHAVVLCPGLFLSIPADWKRVEALLRRGGSGAASVTTEEALTLCRSARARSLGNASSWLYTWIDADGGLRAFRRARDLSSALLLGGQAPTVAAATPAPGAEGARLLRLEHAAARLAIELEVSLVQPGRRAYAMVGPFALSYRSAAESRIYDRPEVRILLGAAEATLRGCAARRASLAEAAPEIAEAARALGWITTAPR